MVTAGLNLHPSERLDVGVQVDRMTGVAALDPFALGSAEYAARVPSLSYDFSLTHTNSDIDLHRLDGRVSARYRVGDRVFVEGLYRYVDYDDAAPYLYDTSGRNHLWSAALGWTF